MKNFIDYLKSLQQNDGDNKKSLLRTFILPLSAVIITILLSVFVIIPQVMDYLRINDQIADLRSQISSLQTKAEVLEGVTESDYQDQLEVVLKALPTERDYVVAATQLQTIAQTSPLTMTGLTFGESGGADSYQIKVDVVGTLAGVKNFIHRVDSAPRVMKVGVIDISPERPPLYTASITINAYFSPLATQVGKVDQPVASLTESDLEFIQKLSTEFATIPGVFTTPGTRSTGRLDPFE